MSSSSSAQQQLRNFVLDVESFIRDGCGLLRNDGACGDLALFVNRMQQLLFRGLLHSSHLSRESNLCKYLNRILSEMDGETTELSYTNGIGEFLKFRYIIF